MRQFYVLTLLQLMEYTAALEPESPEYLERIKQIVWLRRMIRETRKVA